MELTGALPAETGGEIRPPFDVTLHPPSGTLGGGATVGVSATPPQPFLLLGEAGGSRLEFAKARLDAGVTMAFDTATGTARTSPVADGEVTGGKLVIDSSGGDGFISTLLSGVHFETGFGVGFTFSADTGLHFHGSGALQIQIPVHVELGPVEVQAVYVRAGLQDGKVPIELSAGFAANLGPIRASVDRLGLLATLSFPDGGGNLGPADLAFGFKPPNGVGLAVDAGVVTGGGFLDIDPAAGEYSGALELELLDFLSLKAIGLIFRSRTVVERRAVPFRIGTDLAALDLRLMMGRRWAKLMAERPLLLLARQAIIDRWPVRPPDPTSEGDTALVANPDVWATTQAVAGRSMDGYELYIHLKGGGHAYDGVPGVISIVKQELDKLNGRFIAWFEGLIAQPSGTPEAYDPARLEHRFSLGVPESTGETVLAAGEYPGGTLDWYGFSYDRSGTTLGTSGGPATAASVTRTVIPGQVRYGGMPNPRWWMFEDGTTDFGAVTADSTDLVKTLFLEFALVFADDWFLLPCDLDQGTLARVDGLVFTDVFGQRNWIEPAGSGDDDDWQRWSMYNLDVAGDGDGTGAPVAASLGLFLPPTAPGTAEGPPSEYVLMVRDEMANMVWGVERTVPLATGAAQTGEEAARQTLAFRKRLHPSSQPGAPVAAVAYEAQNTVPENWIPFVPVRVPGSNREIQLQRGAMPRVLDGVVTPPVKVRPRTTLLRPGLDVSPAAPYFVHEEEVPRAGTRLTVAFNRVRRADGGPVVWLSARRSTGRGEAHSGLEWDRLTDSPTPVPGA